MTVQQLYDDIVGLSDIHKILGVKDFRVKRWVERRETVGCPKPIKRVGMTDLYSASEWQGWYAVWKVTRGSETWRRIPRKPPVLFTDLKNPD